MTSYLYASVVRLTMDDPRNENMNEGDIMVTAGKHEDGYSYTVLDERVEGFTDVECETLGVLKAESRMCESEIKRWAASEDRAKEIAEGAV